MPDLVTVLEVLDGHMAAPASTSSGWQVEVWMLRALLLQALGRIEEAVPALARALTIAQESGQVLAFLEHGPPMAKLLKEAVRRNPEASYARRILEAFEAHQQTLMARQADRGTPLTQTALVEPLSERELQVLRYLQGTLSLGGIADQLYLSIHTVRSHVKHIYTKLDVHSRGEAIARAEALGLL
jgi:LuxR family maltose regulon positive regulatory protein